jgi:hypothetical protein
MSNVYGSRENSVYGLLHTHCLASIITSSLPVLLSMLALLTPTLFYCPATNTRHFSSSAFSIFIFKREGLFEKQSLIRFI